MSLPIWVGVAVLQKIAIVFDDEVLLVGALVRVPFVRADEEFAAIVRVQSSVEVKWVPGLVGDGLSRHPCKRPVHRQVGNSDPHVRIPPEWVDQVSDQIVLIVRIDRHQVRGLTTATLGQFGGTGVGHVPRELLRDEAVFVSIGGARAQVVAKVSRRRGTGRPQRCWHHGRHGTWNGRRNARSHRATPFHTLFHALAASHLWLLWREVPIGRIHPDEAGVHQTCSARAMTLTSEEAVLVGSILIGRPHGRRSLHVLPLACGRRRKEQPEAKSRRQQPQPQPGKVHACARVSLLVLSRAGQGQARTLGRWPLVDLLERLAQGEEHIRSLNRV